MPTLDELESRWQPLSQEVLRAMKEWRRQHPRATLQEIETALDVQLARLRAQMLQDTALTSTVSHKFSDGRQAANGNPLYVQR